METLTETETKIQQIILKSLSIINFKGIKELVINLNPDSTDIFGDNATGKTTIVDAFLWLFFGKNTDDASNFEIKRLDEKNNFIKNIDVEVSTDFTLNGREINVKKVLRQKWVKRRGEIEAVYSGDENIYFWNDVPLKESEFKEKTKAIINEALFKLMTNPFYFNYLKWTERRNILVDLAGNITNDEIFDAVITVQNKGRFNPLINALNADKTLDEFKKELGAKKKKIKDEAESIPSRIDEVKRGLPEAIDFAALKSKIAQLENSIAAIDTQLNDEVAKLSAENKTRSKLVEEYHKEIREKQDQIYKLKSEMQTIQHETKQKANEGPAKVQAELKAVSNSIEEKQKEKDRFLQVITSLQDQGLKIENNIAALRLQYVTVDAEQFTFDEKECLCPTCKQALPADNVDAKRNELSTNFNLNKVSKLEGITTEAGRLKSELDALNIRINGGRESVSKIEAEMEVLNTRLPALQSTNPQDPETLFQSLLNENPEYQALNKKLVEWESIEVIEPVFQPIQTNDAMNEKKKALVGELSELKKEAAKEDQIVKADARIFELKNQETTLAEQLAELEGYEFALMEFSKAKVDSIEKRINGKFKYVKFKMFDKQVNGGEVECCETLVNSNGAFVPFTDANNAAKINSGIDIINTLTKHYKISAPIFIDNRESVTRLINCNSQIINLIVSEQDKKLRIS